MGALSSEKRTIANRANARLPRRVRITSDLTKDICELVRAGVRPETAAVMNGVARSTYYEWLDKGKHPDARPILREFIDSIDLACAEWEAGDVLLIGKAARQENPGEWTAAAWRLERRLPQVYARKTEKKVDYNVTIELERKQTGEALIDAATRAFADDPVALERLLAELAVGQPAVVEGEAVEVAELAP